MAADNQASTQDTEPLFVANVAQQGHNRSRSAELRYDPCHVFLGGHNVEVTNDHPRHELEDSMSWLAQKAHLSRTRWRQDWKKTMEILKQKGYQFTKDSVLIDGDVAAAIMWYIFVNSRQDGLEKHDSAHLTVQLQVCQGCLILHQITDYGSHSIHTENGPNHHSNSSFNISYLADTDPSLAVYKRTLGRHRLVVLQRRVRNKGGGTKPSDCWSEASIPELSQIDSVLCTDKSTAITEKVTDLLKKFDDILHDLRKRIVKESCPAWKVQLTSSGDVYAYHSQSDKDDEVHREVLSMFAKQNASAKRPKPDGAGAGAAATAPRTSCKDILQQKYRRKTLDGRVNLAIIVPYRAQKEQNRAEQLNKFSAEMPQFLRHHCNTDQLGRFHIFIIEQSDDGYKFNRGKLLNAGYVIARQSSKGGKEGFNAFCLHDVDLLPGQELARYYSMYPERPIHIAAVWERYKSIKNYIGGILTVSDETMRKCNGFPNNYWGWGGEDDELWDRLVEIGDASIIRPEITASSGAISDLEEKFIKEKGGTRAGEKIGKGGRKEFKNLKKYELREMHSQTWKENGIKDLEFSVLKQRPINDDVTIYKVDLLAREYSDAAALSEELKAYPKGFRKQQRLAGNA